MHEYYQICKFSKPKYVKHKRETVTKETYKTVYEACKGRCVLCGRRDGLQLHHIYSRGKDLTNNVKNCVMLCLECHLYRVHRNLKYYRPILNEITKEIYKEN